VIVLLLICSAMPATFHAQQLAVGNAAGEPGWNVQFEVSFTASGPGVSAVEVDIGYDAENSPITRTDELKPNCVVAPTHGKTGYFAFHPVGCLPDECEFIRAVLISTASRAQLRAQSLALAHSSRARSAFHSRLQRGTMR
jgi:hypothetical protein